MNFLDHAIISFFNQFANKFPALDHFIGFIGTDSLVRGGLMMALFWWSWFQYGEANEHNKTNRERILATVLASMFGVFIARILAIILPFRTRPMHDPLVPFHFPIRDEILQGWSSFPSDHAVLFFSLAMGLFLCSRFLGTIAFIDTIFFICIPRIYLGIHYPTDIIAGAFLGIGLTFFAHQKQIRSLIAKWPLKLWEVHPGSFCAASFLLSYEIADIFESILALLKGVAKNLIHFIH
jgi:undecaprenyl-diphosphatase